ncbi:RNA-directed DNA polymerase (Reverse transcriptase), Ribonuclease H [Gossypium australe]|uniref:RNA-directed DNA polymerase (Reverse transcriptase), Ribonuclease H n=1 Tax=Gossypium australe TaxID=47621 RepID=A0A5B6VV30_9ROSI|nr:RNA-directed DNA polymerase (Reverse transcriptase), Ribonuclease H [Gossypium australe]
MLYHTTWLISKIDHLKYMMESTALNTRMARWQILLSEFDIIYVNQKVVKGSATTDFLASAQTEYPWKLNFGDASNAISNGIGVVLVSLDEDHYLFTSKLNFDYTNDMIEYEACIMGICATIERKIKVLEVFWDFTLVIYQLKGEWETRDPKLIDYQKLVLDLIKEFDNITFEPHNQGAHSRATYQGAQMSHVIENNKRILRRLTNEYVLDGEIIYKRIKDQVLLSCVDVVGAKKILEEAYEGVYGTHANGFTMARQIM